VNLKTKYNDVIGRMKIVLTCKRFPVPMEKSYKKSCSVKINPSIDF